ncbi:hypothetical protein CDAR_96401 [Caerostris darwini]|uniref:Uncharacterized protein n=1 Tax=Caerostris darwini TaxID=1538125 RepID=A0AAV4TAX0_9ARAC|nr:hypothetical protein CDAR_96401 [Caerostris darwini]
MLVLSVKVILQGGPTPPHTAKAIRDIISAFGGKFYPPPPYLSESAPSDYHLFSSMFNDAFSMKHINSYENVEKGLHDWTISTYIWFFWEGIHILPMRWGKM